MDDEDEEEMEWTDEEEEELEEDDVNLTEKPHKKSEFMDEEAEESDQGEAVADKEGYESGAEDETDTESESAAEEPEEEGKRKVLKRIVKPADDDDSEDEDLFGESANLQPPSNFQLDSTVTGKQFACKKKTIFYNCFQLMKMKFLLINCPHLLLQSSHKSVKESL